MKGDGSQSNGDSPLLTGDSPLSIGNRPLLIILELEKREKTSIIVVGVLLSGHEEKWRRLVRLCMII